MPKNIEQYLNERNEVVNKLLYIIGQNNNNIMFSLKEFDENEDIQKQIYELEDDIKKYYVCSKWSI